MTINFNQPPYFDDYNEDKKFYKILFRPGYAVQTRELNQLQTILQKQVSRFGDGIYKEGAMVIPGALAYKSEYPYVKINGAITSLVVNNGNESETAIIEPSQIEAIIIASVGKRIVGETTGVQGTIKSYRLATNNDPLTLYIEYDSSGTDGTTKVFGDAEPLTIKDQSVVSATNYTGHRVQSIAVAATGNASAASVEKGVYFVRGNFVLVDSQTLLLDPYGTTPSYRIGFKIYESITTPELDPTLNDNANGSFNYSAPGAHRHSIELRLSKLEISSNDDTDFVELLVVRDGIREAHITKTEYSELAKEFARRTYDESGDYTVSGFRMSSKESRNNDRGEWQAGTAYLPGDIVTRTITTIENETSVTRVYNYTALTAGNSGFNGPSHTFGSAVDGGVTWSYEPYPVYNSGQSLDGDSTKITIAIEPGKAYVRGFEIDKPSTTFVEIDKAREFAQVNNDLIATTIGNYVLCDSFIGVPDFTVFSEVNLYRHTRTDNTVIGTARIRGLERDFSGLFKLYLFDVNLNSAQFSFSRDVKHIGNAEFECALVNVNPSLGIGSISIAAPVANVSTVTGVGTNFLATFKIGDYLDVDGIYFRITNVAQSTLTIDNTLGATINGATYKLFLTAELDQSRITSIFPLGKSRIKSLRDESGDIPVIDASYVVMQKAVVTTAVGETTKTISLANAQNSTGVGSSIDPNTEVSEIIVARFDDEFFTPSSFSVGVDDTSFTIGGLDPSTTYTVFFPVTKATPTTARFKTKTLMTYQTKEITTADAISSRVISIGKADVYRIRQILMADTTGAISGNLIDITDRFTFDTGQKDTHYGISSIVRKPSYGAPTGSIRIIYDYFEHSSTGDYFCIDSYINFLPENIPSYTMANGIVYRLGDVLDFRPRISDSGLNFVDGGAKLAMPPKPGTSTRVDYTYYLPRTDKISIDVNGKFVITKGSSSDNPIMPETPDLTMNMAIIKLEPYTYSPQEAVIEKIDNRRYTMRDIGVIERRVTNLEYYTSLSLLEQEASTLQIQDELGLNRFKNGFIVDNFTSHTVSDATSNDFRASIDSEAQELRPSFVMDNINLIEKATPTTRTGYTVNGDIITLPYTEKSFISQLYASEPENINPFAIFTFIGQAELNPSSDEWIETQRLPDVVNDVEGNFADVLANAQAAGILGNQWNAWETTWVGTTTRQINTTRRSRLVNWGARAVDTETSQITNQTRTGINTSVQATFTREFVDDRVVSTSVIPWIRSRSLVFVARGMRLNTIVYPFFDSTNIQEYITPASRIEFKGTDLANPENIDVFDFETNVGADNDEKARRFGGNVQTAYNKGDVIYVKRRGSTTYASPDVSPCTAVCVLQEIQPGVDTYSALVVNTTGSFQPGDLIGGTVSGSEAEIVSFTLGQKGSQLITNFAGDVAGVFQIPNTNSLRFATGTREFKLIDNLTNNDLIAKTRAHADYRAQGTLQRWQATFNSIRNGEIVRTRISDSRTLTSVISVVETNWYDPLAQTFLVQNQGGVFVTSIDIWFASVDPIKPVTMQLREVVNGYPGKVILPFSNVTLHPYELITKNQPPGYGLSSDTVMYEGTEYLAPNKPTKFKMRAPVYLQDLTEYCIVLLSDSNNYNVWISNLGGIDLTSSTPRLISEQPYAGVLFKSQNGSTWTASQNQDLTFRINVAQFDQFGSVEFHNSRLNTFELSENALFTRNQSKLVRVFHPNHGQVVGSNVNISGVLETATRNGVPIADLNKMHTILSVEQDSYVIRVSTAANRTGRMGGAGIISTYNIKFDTIHPIISNQNFSDTDLDFSIKTTSSQSISGFETPGVFSNAFSSIIANENNDFFAPQMVCSPENEQLYLDGAKSILLRADMATSNPYLSPVIDTSRLSIIAVNNRIDAQTYELANYVGETADGDFDVYTLAANAFIAFSGNQITTTDVDTRSVFSAQRPGKYILVSGSTNPANNGRHLIVSIAEDGSAITTASTFATQVAGALITIRIYDNFIEETAKDGSAISKYLTKRVDLSNSSGVSNNLNIRFTANIPPSAFVEVYYKVGLVASAVPFEDVEWTLFATQSVTQGKRDVAFDVNDLASFNAAAIKLVMKSTSSSAIPRISDFIVVATA